jgi:hypothetical protein
VTHRKRRSVSLQSAFPPRRQDREVGVERKQTRSKPQVTEVVNRPRGISKRLFKPSSAQPIARTVHRTPYDG